MTEILRVISEQNLDTFEKIKTYFKQPPLYLHVVEDANCYLLKYDQIKTDFSHPAALEARGIIFEKGTNRVVCYPFSKFFNAREKYAANIDWPTASVQHKYDGSIIKLYYMNMPAGKDNKWIVATNGTIDAHNATVGSANNNNNTQKTFYDLFLDAAKLSHLDFARLDTRCTYMFELMHPESTVVIRYKTPRLVHLGTRNNTTFAESYESIGVEQVETFPISTYEDCQRAAHALGANQEGFVVCDSQWRRVKIKGSIYIELHHSLTGNHLTAEEAAAQMILQGQQQEVQAYADDERIGNITKCFEQIEKNLDTVAQKLADIWSTIMKSNPTSQKEIAVAAKKEAGVYFSLMMERCRQEKKKNTESALVESEKNIFRHIIVEKYKDSLHRSETRDFLAFIKQQQQ